MAYKSTGKQERKLNIVLIESRFSKRNLGKAALFVLTETRDPSQSKGCLKIMELEEEINNDIDRLVDLKSDITHLIKKLENHEYQILLEQRCLLFKSWEMIAVDLGYSIQHTFRLYDAALQELSKFYKDESK